MANTKFTVCVLLLVRSGLVWSPHHRLRDRQHVVVVDVSYAAKNSHHNQINQRSNMSNIDLQQDRTRQALYPSYAFPLAVVPYYLATCCSSLVCASVSNSMSTDFHLHQPAASLLPVGHTSPLLRRLVV